MYVRIDSFFLLICWSVSSPNPAWRTALRPWAPHMRRESIPTDHRDALDPLHLHSLNSTNQNNINNSNSNNIAKSSNHSSNDSKQDVPTPPQEDTAPEIEKTTKLEPEPEAHDQEEKKPRLHFHK